MDLKTFYAATISRVLSYIRVKHCYFCFRFLTKKKKRKHGFIPQVFLLDKCDEFLRSCPSLQSPPSHTHTQRLDCLQISNQVVIFSQIETNFKQLNTDDYLGHSIHEFMVFLARLMLVWATLRALTNVVTIWKWKLGKLELCWCAAQDTTL